MLAARVGKEGVDEGDLEKGGREGRREGGRERGREGRWERRREAYNWQFNIV
jgi:hypothetical protein